VIQRRIFINQDPEVIFQEIPFVPFQFWNENLTNIENENQEVEHVVEEIRQRKFKDGIWQWKVKWTDGDITWETQDAFVSENVCNSLWQDFNIQNPFPAIELEKPKKRKRQNSKLPNGAPQQKRRKVKKCLF